MAYVFILLVACLITGCSEPEDKKDPRFVPQLNPHPKYFITVEGDIDPGIAEDLTLSWHIAYATHNDACHKVVNYFEGAEVARFMEETVTFLTNAGHYRYKLPLDKYLPGYCRWEATSMDYYFGSMSNRYKFTSGSDFTEDSPITHADFSITWQCNENSCHVANKTSTTPFYLPKPNNFHYMVNITRS